MMRPLGECLYAVYRSQNRMGTESCQTPTVRAPSDSHKEKQGKHLPGLCAVLICESFTILILESMSSPAVDLVLPPDLLLSL